MKLDASHPLNRVLVRSLSARKPAASAITSPDSHPDPYYALGCHPDVVEHIWDKLGASLPSACRAVVYGTPALVHRRAGVVLAMAYGTAYAIRVPSGCMDAALKAGCHIERTWSGGSKTHIEAELGPGWVFGAWGKDEAEWLAGVHRELDDA